MFSPKKLWKISDLRQSRSGDLHGDVVDHEFRQGFLAIFGGKDLRLALILNPSPPGEGESSRSPLESNAGAAEDGLKTHII